ncbi:MAG: hypothetical protein Q9219_000147 [cf. Caloplaca sp. 3 TL-2023]
MNHQDNIRIITTGVEDAQREQQARREQPARASEDGPAVDLKLTVDLSKRNLYEIPEEVIDLLETDVERFLLTMPTHQVSQPSGKPLPRISSSCKSGPPADTELRLIEAQLLALPQLEILDLSVNKIRIIPEEIRSMRSLRVLSLTKNKIWSVPTCIKDLDTLRMLKLAGNPLRSDLASIIDAKDTHLPFDEAATDNEKETFITSNLKHHLKVEAASGSGEGSSSEGPLETPRPIMRNGSLRFPVKTNGNASEAASEARSPGFAKPPIPARSHYRVTSGQNNLMQKSGLRRPGLAPLNVGNERNRSNSESILQMTQNNRSKRMGMVPEKKNDLSTVTENQQNRNSFHLRGQSHASALPDWNQLGDLSDSATMDSHPTSRQYLQRISHPAHTFTSCISKERKQRKQASKPHFTDSAISVRYSLSAFHQTINSLISSLPSRSQKGWSRLRDAQHEASFRIASLHQSVSMLAQEEQSDLSTRLKRKEAAGFSINACNSAITRHIRLASSLLDHLPQVLADGAMVYLRTFALHVLGTSTELCHAFPTHAPSSKRTTITRKRLTSKKFVTRATHRALRDEALRDQSLTPTRERPVTAKRIKNWDSLQATNVSNSSKPAAAVQHPTTQFTPHNPTPQPIGPPPSIPQPPVPLYLNGRSRSNSRVDQHNLPSSSTDSNFTMSPAMTPSSLGAFSVPGTPLNRSRSSSIAASTHGGRMTPGSGTPYYENDPALSAQFDKIHSLLDRTVVHGRKALPIVKDHFMRALDEARTDLDRAHCEEWARRVRTCSLTSELSSIMHRRLQAVRHPDPLSSAWNDKGFWELAKRFLAAVSDLLQDVRAGFREGYVHEEVVTLMRPVSNLCKATSHEIRDSPWNYFLSSAVGQMGMPVSPGSSVSSIIVGGGGGGGSGGGSNGALYGHQRQRRSSGSNSYASASIPPTPLSAALGPAAQATVPSTPATSGSLERSFQGGWGERADALLQMQQTMVYRR